jgi:hypothetical protein
MENLGGMGGFMARSELVPMKRFGLILAASWLITGSVSKAGELDAEYGGQAKAVDAVRVVAKASTELDSESPTQSCCFKRRFYTYYGGYGYGGFGYGGYAYGRRCCLIGYGGYGGGLGYGGFGGYGGSFGYGGFGGYGGGFY